LEVFRPLLLVLPVVGAVVAPPAAATPPAEEARILAAIRSREQRFLTRFQGIAERRRAVVRMYGPDGDRPIRTTRSEVDWVHYFYRRPDVKIRSCAVDGVAAANDRCVTRWQRLMPHVQIFDRDGLRHYRVRISGLVTLNGQRCYRLEVQPRVRTSRHFVGQVYVRVDDLQLVQMEGTVADLPFFVQHVFLRLAFRGYDGFAGLARGYVDVWLGIPLIYKRRIVTRFTARGHRPVPR
jgi:hypothetical protein